MLIDPIGVSANSPTPALSFAVVSYDATGSTRKDVTNGYDLTFSHSSSPKTGERHYMQLKQAIVGVDPITGGNAALSASVSLSVSIPTFGWTASTKAALVQALIDTLLDSDVTIAKFLAYQS
jgi:hypothetical protein